MATVANPVGRVAAERVFFTGMAGFMLLSVVIGFAPSWFLRPIYGAPAGVQPLNLTVALHGLVFTGWMVLLVVQAGLGAADRRDLHKLLGITGLGFAVAMIVLGTLAGLGGIHRASGPPVVPPLSWSAIPLLSVPAFGGLILAALWQRRNSPAHKRLMVLGTIAMMGAAFGRMPAFAGLAGIVLLPNLLILAIVVWDVATRRRVHPATAWGGLVAFVGITLPIFVWQTDAWTGFARWASGFVA